MNFWFNLSLRFRLGIAAIVMAALAGYSLYQYSCDPLHSRPIYSLVKLVPILCLLWLALPDLEKIPMWCYLVAVPIIIFCAVKPAAMLVIIPAVLLVLFVMPKK
ncbi:hypothetical protein FACS189427_02470 [Planctomycetales bacterium]|nr:hypothetical protein FACS189427_02470 [Planctomycetales bacterium]